MSGLKKLFKEKEHYAARALDGFTFGLGMPAMAGAGALKDKALGDRRSVFELWGENGKIMEDAQADFIKRNKTGGFFAELLGAAANPVSGAAYALPYTAVSNAAGAASGRQTPEGSVFSLALAGLGGGIAGGFLGGVSSKMFPKPKIIVSACEYPAESYQSLKALRAAAKKYYKDFLQGETQYRQGIGHIRFTNRGLGETTYRDYFGNNLNLFPHLRKTMQHGAPQPKQGLYKNRVDDFENFQDITEPVLYKGLRRKAVVNIAYEKNKGPVFNLAKIEPAPRADLISGLSRFYRPLPRAGNSPGLQGLMNNIANMPYKIKRGVYKGLYPAFGQAIKIADDNVAIEEAE